MGRSQKRLVKSIIKKDKSHFKKFRQSDRFTRQKNKRVRLAKKLEKYFKKQRR